MNLILILAVAVLIVLMCYQYLPVNSPDTLKYHHDVVTVEYVLDNPDILIENLGFSSYGTWNEGNKVNYDYILPIELYADPTDPKQAYFIDIVGENGYLIVDAENNLYQYQVSGDYPQLLDAENVFFSPYDGLVYKYKGKQHMVTGSMQIILPQRERLSAYVGQRSPGDGDIYQPQSYVADRYGAGYEVVYAYSLRNFTYATQGDTSIYFRGSGSRSEGNCTLTAMYNALNYVSFTNLGGSMPTSRNITQVDAKKDAFYAKYSSDRTYVIVTPKVLPELYANIRAYAISAHGYEVEALTQLEVEDVMNHMLTEYGSTLKAKNYYSASYYQQVLQPVSHDLPVLNNVTKSSTYGSHSMVVTGYQVYASCTDIGDLHLLNYLLMLQVADGWSSDARYYDANLNKDLEIVTVLETK